MKKLSISFVALAIVLGVACAKQAPDLPQGVAPEQVTFDNQGEAWVQSGGGEYWCITCCPWQCPGPEDCCGPWDWDY